MRLTNSIRSQICDYICEPKKEIVKEYRQQLMLFITPLVMASLPKRVVEVFKDYPDYFCISTRVDIMYGKNIIYKGLIDDYFPYIMHPHVVKVDKKAAQQIKRLVARVQGQEEHVRSVRRSTWEILRSFTTIQGLNKAFPELAAYIPESFKKPVVKVKTNSPELVKKIKELKKQL